MIFNLIIFLFAFNLISKDFEQYIFELNQEDPDNNFIEIFEYYREYPIDIYSTNEYELSRLPDISLPLALNIIKALDLNTWPEIQAKYNLTDFQIYILENSTNIINKNKNSYNFRSRYINTLQNNSGELNNSFAGNKLDLYNRIGIKQNNFNFNLITNKDAGEESLADDYTLNLSYNFKNHKIIIGDFRAHTGYGLLLNSGFPIRKSSNPSDALINYGVGFTPSRNLVALGSFRGVAYQNDFLLNKLRVKSRLFYSYTPRSSTQNNNEVSSIYLTNLFRTETELEKKNNLTENILFSNIEIDYKNLSFGINYLNFNYSKILNTESQNFYKGKNGNNFSLYSKFKLTNSTFNYETAIDNNFNLSHYFIYNYFNNNIDFGFSYKYLHPNSRLQYNNILTNYSTNSNESGFFTYLTLKRNNFTNTVFIDFYSRPKIDNYQDMPQSGIDIFDEFTYKISKKVTYLTRLRLRNFKDFLKSTPNYFDKQRLDFRNEIRYNDNFNLRFRLDLVQSEFSENRYSGFGYLIFGEVSKSIFKGNNTSLRLTYYDTDSFEETIWHYEYLVRGYLTAPPLYNNGYKIIFRSSYSFLQDFLLSFALTYDNGIDFNSFGSGLNEIPQNQRTRIFLQLDYNLK